MAFIGEFDRSIDAKGRLIVPSALREELGGETVWLTGWLEDCVAIWSEQSWREIDTRLQELGTSSRAARTLHRRVYGSAHRDRVDKQGRITVPQKLRDLAGLDKDVVVVGAGSHGEIWNPERYEELKSSGEGQLEELTEGLNF